MSVRTVMVVVLALVFGLSAAMGVNMMVNRPAGAAAVATVPVVTAAVALPRGGTITAEQVKLADYPKNMVPAGAFTKLEDAVDRSIAMPLLPGEPVVDGKLTPKGGGRGLAALVPRGMRAFTITTPNVASGVAGFILPGNRVDVLLTMAGSSDDDSGGGSTTTLLQHIEILAVDQMIDAPATNMMDASQLRSVTLLVTPDQAAKLDLGQNRGTLHLSLRNLEDTAPADTSPATMAGLRYSQERPEPEPEPEPEPAPAPVATPAPPPRRMYVRTIRGLHEGRVAIDHPDTDQDGP